MLDPACTNILPPICCAAPAKIEISWDDPVLATPVRIVNSPEVSCAMPVCTTMPPVKVAPVDVDIVTVPDVEDAPVPL